jgi:hypothetical protein
MSLPKFFPVVLSLLFTNFGNCMAQSVIGKWKQVSGKMYCTPEAVERSHGHMKDIMDMPAVDATDEFNKDNTLTEIITSGGTKTTNTGTWSASGNNITITVKGEKPMTGEISSNGSILVFTVEMPKTQHQQVSKRVWTYSKM